MVIIMRLNIDCYAFTLEDSLLFECGERLQEPIPCLIICIDFFGIILHAARAVHWSIDSYSFASIRCIYWIKVCYIITAAAFLIYSFFFLTKNGHSFQECKKIFEQPVQTAALRHK